MRFAFGELLHMHQPEHLIDPAGNFRFRQFVLFQAKSDILFHGHMRKQRVRLKHHIDGAQVRRYL